LEPYSERYFEVRISVNEDFGLVNCYVAYEHHQKLEHTYIESHQENEELPEEQKLKTKKLDLRQEEMEERVVSRPVLRNR
jgi:hypothetical protein